MYTNPWDWPVSATDTILEDFPYAPLEDPAENIALRLVILGHLTFNARVWGGSAGRAGRYWDAYRERIIGATNTATVVTWWCKLMDTMSGKPLGDSSLLHEKNILTRPRYLTPAVDDIEVLTVLRTQTADLIDRTRLWVRFRHEDEKES